MSTRFNLQPQEVAEAISMSADGYSQITNINSIPTYGYTITWTNGASGSFVVEVSNDYVPPGPNLYNLPPNAGTWTTLPLSPAVATTGTAGSAYMDVLVTSAVYTRLHFVHSSGSGGTFTATLGGKVK